MTHATSPRPTPSPPSGPRRASRRLRTLGRCRAGLLGWLATIDHQTIGLRYIVTAFVLLPRSPASCALLMRMQLARARATHLLGPDRYNQIFTMHGTTMMFLFAVPVMEAMGVYLVPLMVGTRNVAFPRLNAFGYWIYLFGGLLLLRRACCSNIGAGRRLVRLRAALRARVSRPASASTSGRR